MITLEYQTTKSPFRLPLFLGVVACIVGLTGNLAGMLVSAYVLWPIPGGSPIRPMDLAAFIFLLSFVTGIVGVPFGAAGIALGRNRSRFWLIAAFGIFFSVLPLFTSGLVEGLIIDMHGLILED
jgi:hypothetical protein